MFLFLTSHFLPLPLQPTFNCQSLSYRPQASCYHNNVLVDSGRQYAHTVLTDTYTYRYIILSHNYRLPLPFGVFIVVTLPTYPIA